MGIKPNAQALTDRARKELYLTALYVERIKAKKGKSIYTIEEIEKEIKGQKDEI